MTQAEDKRIARKPFEQIDGGYSYVVAYASQRNASPTTLMQIVATDQRPWRVYSTGSSDPYQAQPLTEHWFTNPAAFADLSAATTFTVSASQPDSTDPQPSVTLDRTVRALPDFTSAEAPLSGWKAAQPTTTQGHRAYVIPLQDQSTTALLLLHLLVDGSNTVQGAAWAIFGTPNEGPSTGTVKPGSLTFSAPAPLWATSRWPKT